MEAAHVIKRHDWLHNEARCPSCGLHLDAHRDLDWYVRENSDARARGARVTHRRCGSTFWLAFDDVEKSK